jgi:hypothetical protein
MTVKRTELNQITPSSSSNQLTGDWVGNYQSSTIGKARVKLSFYQLDPATLSQSPRGQHAGKVAQETVVGIYQTTTGAIGTISGSLQGSEFKLVATQTTPGCPATFQMPGSVDGNTMKWQFQGADCLGPENGTGEASRIVGD